MTSNCKSDVITLHYNTTLTAVVQSIHVSTTSAMLIWSSYTTLELIERKNTMTISTI